MIYRYLRERKIITEKKAETYEDGLVISAPSMWTHILLSLRNKYVIVTIEENIFWGESC